MSSRRAIFSCSEARRGFVLFSQFSRLYVQRSQDGRRCGPSKRRWQHFEQHHARLASSLCRERVVSFNQQAHSRDWADRAASGRPFLRGQRVCDRTRQADQSDAVFVVDAHPGPEQRRLAMGQAPQARTPQIGRCRARQARPRRYFRRPHRQRSRVWPRMHSFSVPLCPDSV